MTDSSLIIDLPQLQWFPGHMKKAERLIKEHLKLVDVVIELRDARLPLSSSNPLIGELIGNKPRLIALNKADLAEERVTKEWVSFFTQQGISAVAIDAVKGRGLKELVAKLQDLARSRTEKLVKHGAKARAARSMILGIPNVGKSSLINRLASSNRAKVENRPGVTRAVQWIRLGTNLELLDMPGILWPKFEDKKAALKLAYTGAISDDVYDLEAVVVRLLALLKLSYQDNLLERFKLNKDSIALLSPADLLVEIGKKRGALVKGGEVDTEKVAKIILNELRLGKLGKISLDKVEDISPIKP